MLAEYIRSKSQHLIEFEVVMMGQWHDVNILRLSMVVDLDPTYMSGGVIVDWDTRLMTIHEQDAIRKRFMGGEFTEHLRYALIKAGFNSKDLVDIEPLDYTSPMRGKELFSAGKAMHDAVRIAYRPV